MLCNFDDQILQYFKTYNSNQHLFHYGLKNRKRIKAQMLNGPRELESFAHLLLRFLFSLIVFHEKTSCSAGVHFVAAQSAKPSYVVLAIADFYFLSICFKKKKGSNVEIL